MHKYKIKKLDLEINIASMVDVVFLLLIFFLVASTFKTNTDEIRATISLPQVDLKLEEVEKHTIILYLDKTGKVNVQDQFIPWDRLEDYLREETKEKLDGIEVYADKEVDFEYIARIMAVAGKLNIEQINFYLEYDKTD
jgi:biopolymer transport protein ExbD